MSLEALKRNNYENCLVLSPSGLPMFRCLRKRIYWYVKRNLAKILSKEEVDTLAASQKEFSACSLNKDTLVAQLQFEPKGTGHSGDKFFLSFKENQCVVCGSIEKSTRHHIVPHCYVKFFTPEIKRNNSYDVMILCAEHHLKYEESARELKAKLAEEYDVPLHGINGTFLKSKYKALCHIKTLLKFKHKIPEKRQKEMLQEISNALECEATFENIASLTNTKYNKPPSKLHGEMLLEKIENINNFVIMWRKHFIKKMKPQYLPKYWDIERYIYKG